MNAVFYTADLLPWVEDLGGIPWPLLPVANRPLMDYWLEFCAEQEIKLVQVILGEGAEKVEKFAGDGSRWGIAIQYSFARAGEQPLDYLKTASDRWDDGLLYFGGPLHLRRRKAYTPSQLEKLSACRHGGEENPIFFYGKNGAEVKDLLEGGSGSALGLEQIHINLCPLGNITDFFDLNMKMVMGEFSRYLTAGFSERDGLSIGQNVLTPPSAHIKPPVIIGNACRFGAMTTIGPKVVVGDHVIIDSHTELANCMILQDTYVGQNLEINNKIIAGNCLIDPSDGTVVEIDDSWVVAQNRPDMRTEDLFRYSILWILAVGICLLQLVPFSLLYPLIRVLRLGAFKREQFHDPHKGFVKLPVFKTLKTGSPFLLRVFRTFSLDRFPLMLRALSGRLFVCGQPPMRHPEDDKIVKELSQYYPAVFSYEDYCKDSDRLVDSLWYAHIRSLFEDVKILIKALLHRFFQAGK